MFAWNFVTKRGKLRSEKLTAFLKWHSAMSRSTAFEWCRGFKISREFWTDGHRSDARLCRQRMKKLNIQCVGAFGSTMNSTRNCGRRRDVRRIVFQNFDWKFGHAACLQNSIPRLHTVERKENLLKILTAPLQKAEANENFMQWIIKGDATCVYGCDVDRNRSHRRVERAPPQAVFSHQHGNTLAW